MADILPFQFDTHEIRVRLDEDGAPWWIAKDVCDALGIQNASDTVKRLTPLETSNIDLIYAGMPRRFILVNESGLYRIIFRSDKPEAKKFQDCVFQEVLPAIRKTGAYVVPQGQQRAQNDPVEKYPELRAIRELIIATAEARDEATLARHEAHAAEIRAIRAETKADLALEDAHRMSIESFVLKNGLLDQFPPATWRGMAVWLGKFCLEYGMKVEKTPTPGKVWADENTYPLPALGAWLYHVTHGARQITLVPKNSPTVTDEGISDGTR